MRPDHSIIPDVMNPALTPQMEREVQFFLKWGYLIVENAISQKQVEVLGEALDKTFRRVGEMFTHVLLEEDDRFAFLLDNPPVFERMQAILGNCVQLHSATARVTEPGTPDQDWHRDIPWPVDPEGTPYGSVPAQINCGYYLDELTLENGPIAIVPGSQKALFKPPLGHPKFPDELVILAKPGQAIMFNGWIYHRGMANNSNSIRRTCLMCYQNAWIKSREPFDGPRVTALREKGSAAQRLLLGEVNKW